MKWWLMLCNIFAALLALVAMGLFLIAAALSFAAVGIGIFAHWTISLMASAATNNLMKILKPDRKR